MWRDICSSACVHPCQVRHPKQAFSCFSTTSIHIIQHGIEEQVRSLS